MINRVVLVGRLTKDAELRYTPSGVAVSTFTLAVTRPFKRDETDFIPIVAWRNAAENTANYTKKGSLVGIDGRIQTRSYDGKNNKVYVTEVVADSVQFLGSKKNDNHTSQNTSQNVNHDSHDPFSNDGQPVDIPDDDIPF